MYLLLDICNESSFLTVFLILKYVFSILCTVIPLILIYRCTVPLFKAVTSGKNFSEELGPMVRSIIAGLIIFLLPSLFSFIFVDLLDESNGLSQCFTNSTVENIQTLKEAETQGRKDEIEDKKDKINQAASDRAEEEEKRNEEIKEAIKEKEEQERLEQEQANQNAANSGSSPGSSNTTLKTAAKNIIIGDSRTVGMCASITGDWTNCQFNNGGAFINGDDIYIAKGSMGYSWFYSTAVPAVNNIIASNPDTIFNIYSLMGVNFLLSDIDKYIPAYKSLAQNEWKNHNLILVSVNPVDEAKEAQNGYSTKNSSIISFNTQLKNGTSGVSNIKYCDTYNAVIGNLGTSDGLHYTSSTYISIYNKMKTCGS